MTQFQFIEETAAHFEYAAVEYEGSSEGPIQHHIEEYKGPIEGPGEHHTEEGLEEHRSEEHEGPTEAPPMGHQVQPARKKRRPPRGT